jgi:hypothetical protein
MTATLGSVWSSSLPLISSAIFSNIQLAYLLLLTGEALTAQTAMEYEGYAFIMATILAGFATVFLSFIANSSPFTSPRGFLSFSALFFLIGFVLLVVVDYKFYNESFERSTVADIREPFGYIVPGFFFTQLAISLLQVAGRSLIFVRFGPDAQVGAQSWATALTLSVAFAFRLVFGLVIRTNDSYIFDPAYSRSVTIPFAAVGLLLILLSLCVTPFQDVERVAIEWKSLTSIRAVPGFFGTVAPLFFVILAYQAIDYTTPILVSSLEVDNFTIQDSAGLELVSLGALCIAGIVGVLAVRKLGVQTGIVVTVWLSAVIQVVQTFDLNPPSRMVGYFGTAFSGFGLGAVLAGGWAAIGMATPAQLAAKYAGLFEGLLAALQTLPIAIRSLTDNVNFIAVPMLVVGGMLAFGLPEGLGRDADEGFGTTEGTLR